MNDGALSQLRAVCARTGLDGLDRELGRLIDFLERDLSALEDQLAALGPGRKLTVVDKSVAHLLHAGGKRLRPLLAALASRVSGRFDPAAMDVAIAVELVHSATLLHDDVVDLGMMRRGEHAARILYGNAASIFAGDWLLVEALRRVCRSEVPGALDRLLSAIDEMIAAEAVQLERRGRFDTDRIDVAREAYFQISEGKTASLFRWAMYAGGRAGGAEGATLAALEAYGLELGIAFQAIDDAIDLGSGAAEAKKSIAVDLREGKITYPIIVALERDRRGELAPLLEQIVREAEDAEDVPSALRDRALALIRELGALEATVSLAKDRVRRAREQLEILPASAVKTLLLVLAEGVVQRRF